MFTHLDLFTGIGGFSLALRNIYPGKIKTSYSEIDKYAEKIYKRHFPEAKALGDIKTIRGGEIVLDPFIGSGTTGIVARKLNRNYIGIDLKYHIISDDRLTKELGFFK